jgi:hypothetical protein
MIDRKKFFRCCTVSGCKTFLVLGEVESFSAMTDELLEKQSELDAHHREVYSEPEWK